MQTRIVCAIMLLWATSHSEAKAWNPEQEECRGGPCDRLYWPTFRANGPINRAQMVKIDDVTFNGVNPVDDTELIMIDADEHGPPINGEVSNPDAWNEMAAEGSWKASEDHSTTPENPPPPPPPIIGMSEVEPAYTPQWLMDLECPMDNSCIIQYDGMTIYKVRIPPPVIYVSAPPSSDENGPTVGGVLGWLVIFGLFVGMLMGRRFTLQRSV